MGLGHSPEREAPSRPRRARSRSRSRSPLAAVEIDRRALTRGSLYGLAVIAPVSIGVEVLDAVDVLSRGPVVFIPALAGLAAFFPWLTLRMATHLVLGERLLGKEGDTAVTVVLTVATVALLSMSGGILGGLLARRDDGRAA